jgi:hypothetical protein
METLFVQHKSMMRFMQNRIRIRMEIWLINWLIMIGWDYVSELRSSADLLFVPGWYVSMESHGDDDACWG